MLAKDSNIMVAASSAQLLTRLARGLGNKFEIHAPGVISTCLLRLKEAKPVVKEPCTGCITACYETTVSFLYFFKFIFLEKEHYFILFMSFDHF